MLSLHDVLVVGSGIAGVTAAIEAARGGARTAIACTGQLFGGSSFYPGTWGLGLVGPADEADEDDLIATILEIGCGVANPELVSAFVHDIRPAIAWLEHDLGVELKRPANEQSAAEAAFIPCFDHKNRMWRGITRHELTRAAQQEFDRLGITVFERHELMALEQDEHGATTGAILFNHRTGMFSTMDARAVVLAAGGTSGLFERRLTAADVLSSVHGIAAQAGCELINLEFMQMMPGLVAPKRGLVFNEKTFRYVRLSPGSHALPADASELAELLERRSGHGPFTSRLDDEAVDLAVDEAGPEGLALSYAFPERDIPEFVQTFTAWLAREHGILPSDELRVAMYAHASNGGVRIGGHGETGVPGLFACGELTGGMHGADRLGGLSSANGLVFGRRAGKAAAHFAQETVPAQGRQLGTRANGQEHARLADDQEPGAAEHKTPPGAALTDAPLSASDAQALTAQLRHAMSTYAMIRRTEAGLTAALAELDALEQRARDASRSKSHADSAATTPTGTAPTATVPAATTPAAADLADAASVARGVRLQSQLTLARAMLRAMRERRESMGSHYRADYPPNNRQNRYT